MTPVDCSPCRPRTIQLPLTASPCSWLSRPQSTISQSDFHPVIRPFSPLRLRRSYRLAPEPDGSPLFTLLPLVACWRYRTPGAPQTARVAAACDSAFPFERQGRYSDHVRFRGYIPFHFIPAYNLPVYASQRPLPDATQDLVRGCSLGFAAAVISEADFNALARRNVHRTGRARLRHPALGQDLTPSPTARRAQAAQAYEPEVPVEMRARISPALASPGFVLELQPPAQPHRGVTVECPIRFADVAFTEFHDDEADEG